MVQGFLFFPSSVHTSDNQHIEQVSIWICECKNI